MGSDLMRGTGLSRHGFDMRIHGELAPRTAVAFTCPKNHTFTVTMAADADPPPTWACRRHGAESQRVDGDQEEKPKKPPRTHWDMLLERRSIHDLELLLVEQLSKMRERHRSTQAAASTNTPQSPADASPE